MVENYAEAWADEILPIAGSAYERLQFSNVQFEEQEGRIVAGGEAREKPQPDHLTYRKWAANIVRDELHKAGWRLAELLQEIL